MKDLEAIKAALKRVPKTTLRVNSGITYFHNADVPTVDFVAYIEAVNPLAISELVARFEAAQAALCNLRHYAKHISCLHRTKGHDESDGYDPMLNCCDWAEVYEIAAAALDCEIAEPELLKAKLVHLEASESNRQKRTKYIEARITKLEAALKPFAEFEPTVTKFIEERAKAANQDGIMGPTNHFRQRHFLDARAALENK